MASFANIVMPSFPMPQMAVSAKQRAATLAVETATFTHALVALAAKLAAVDGTPTKSEYAAFEALFVGDEDKTQLRTLFIKRVTDTSPALQYARQIATMTVGQTTLHHDLLNRLIQVATADGALNAAEMELLRAVAAIFAIDRDTFREAVAQTMVPAGASAYEVLGIAARASDEQIREHYMARVQMLHPDRYHAAGASAETITMLSDQLAAVNAAYSDIQNLRGKKSPRTAGSGWWGRMNAKGAKVSST